MPDHLLDEGLAIVERAFAGVAEERAPGLAVEATA